MLEMVLSVRERIYYSVVRCTWLLNRYFDLPASASIGLGKSSQKIYERLSLLQVDSMLEKTVIFE